MLVSSSWSIAFVWAIVLCLRCMGRLIDLGRRDSHRWRTQLHTQSSKHSSAEPSIAILPDSAGTAEVATSISIVSISHFQKTGGSLVIMMQAMAREGSACDALLCSLSTGGRVLRAHFDAVSFLAVGSGWSGAV